VSPAHWIKAERDFLLARARRPDDYRWVGSSSTALVVSAITGEPPEHRPYDGWDLGRCLVTRAVAPPHLHEAMDAILVGWTERVDAEDKHHGVAAARAMAEKETPVIRAIVEAGSAPSTHGRRG
jgi:hypothetical protein